MKSLRSDEVSWEVEDRDGVEGGKAIEEAEEASDTARGRELGEAQPAEALMEKAVPSAVETGEDCEFRSGRDKLSNERRLEQCESWPEGS